MFSAPTGGPLRHGPFYRRAFKPAVLAAGLPEGLRFHVLHLPARRVTPHLTPAGNLPLHQRGEEPHAAVAKLLLQQGQFALGMLVPEAASHVCLDGGTEPRSAEFNQFRGRRLSVGWPPQLHGQNHQILVPAIEEARPNALGHFGVRDEHMPDRKVGEQPIGFGDQHLGAELHGGIDGQEVLPVQMREPVVAVDDTQADAPNNLPAAAAVCSQDGPSSISASGVTPSIIAQPIEGVSVP